MIGRAIKYIESGRFEGTWKYIMVDEFQDISEPRARLVKCLLDHVKSSVLFCVGDDWQAIYRFAGSDLSLTTQFKEKFGDYDETRLDKTFRFNNKISDVASRFVMKNDSQFEKDIKTHSTVKKPAVMVYRTRDSKSIEEICVVLDAINTAIKDKVSVMILSRYKKGLPEKSDLKQLSNQYPQIEFTVMSAHKSKGSEADFVIVTGVDKGFPSEKTTHPLIEAFLPPSESFHFAEERRLFYVALTRAKRKVYLLANMERPSNFIKELLSEEDYDIAIDDFDVSDTQRNAQISHCPECKTGTLAYREGPYGRFVKCSNDPLCKYSDNRLDCKWCDGQMVRKSESKHCSNESCNFKIAYCPSCWGDLVYRKNGNLYGCTNYRKDYSGSCGHVEKWIDFDNLN